MLKVIKGHETLRHICDYWWPETQELDIFIQDVHPYAVIGKTGKTVGSISFCPYCGIKINNEERP